MLTSKRLLCSQIKGNVWRDADLFVSPPTSLLRRCVSANSVDASAICSLSSHLSVLTQTTSSFCRGNRLPVANWVRTQKLSSLYYFILCFQLINALFRRYQSRLQKLFSMWCHFWIHLVTELDPFRMFSSWSRSNNVVALIICTSVINAARSVSHSARWHLDFNLSWRRDWIRKLISCKSSLKQY